MAVLRQKSVSQQKTVTLQNISQQRGFSLLELICVVVVIGILSVFALRAMDEQIDSAKKATIEGQARSFISIVSAVRVKWVAMSAGDPALARIVRIEQGAVVVSDDGWPVQGLTTKNVETAKTPLLSPEHVCQSLWLALFQNPPTMVVGKAESGARFRVSVFRRGKNNGCRYQLNMPSSEEYYIDYDLTVGRVSTHLPEIQAPDR